MQRTCIYKLNGTNCESCEIVIEREARTISGIKKARAFHKTHQLEIEFDQSADQAKLESDLRERISKHGYSFDDAHPSPLIPHRSSIGATIILLIAVYIIFKSFGLFTFSPEVELGGGLLAIFAIGLIASVSSCTAVVIGLLTAISSTSAQQNTNRSFSDRFRPHVLFNLGRLVGFAFFGALVGFAGSAIQLSPTLNGIFVLLIAIIMVSLGLHLLGLTPKTIHFSPPKWLAHKIHDLQDSKKPFVPFALGALTFFLPCGFTQSMQLYALSLGNPVQAAIAMTVFAFGTAPALLGVGFFTSKTKDVMLSKITKVAGAIVVVLGVSNLQNGATLLGFTTHPKHLLADTSSQMVVKNGRQLVQMEITSDFTYEPSVITVVEDVPVEWEIYGSKSLGCASSLIQRDFGVNANLKSGLNTVRFTPTKTGRFVFSCSMGMIRGTMVVVPRT